MSKDPVKYKMITYKEQPARLYPDGSIRNAKGHWLAKHPAGETITRETASLYRARTIAERQEAASHGIANAIMKYGKVPHGGVVGSVEAWSMAAEQVAEALFSEKYRDRSDALRVLADVTASKYDKTTQAPAQAQPAANNQTLIAVFLQQVAGGDSTDSTVIDAVATESGADEKE